MDASGADFNSADLRGANLAGLNCVSKHNPKLAKLSGANLSRGYSGGQIILIAYWTTPFLLGQMYAGPYFMSPSQRSENGVGKLPEETSDPLLSPAAKLGPLTQSWLKPVGWGKYFITGKIKAFGSTVNDIS